MPLLNSVMRTLWPHASADRTQSDAIMHATRMRQGFMNGPASSLDGSCAYPRLADELPNARLASGPTLMTPPRAQPVRLDRYAGTHDTAIPAGHAAFFSSSPYTGCSFTETEFRLDRRQFIPGSETF